MKITDVNGKRINYLSFDMVNGEESPSILLHFYADPDYFLATKIPDDDFVLQVSTDNITFSDVDGLIPMDAPYTALYLRAKAIDEIRDAATKVCYLGFRKEQTAAAWKA